MTEPFTFARAWEAHKEASREHERAEQDVGVKGRAFAKAEETYRKALALEERRLRRQEGVAWSVMSDLARGEETVAMLKRARDDAEWDAKQAEHAVYRRAADRRDVEGFIDWSKRRDLAEWMGRMPEPDAEPIIGQRRAA